MKKLWERIQALVPHVCIVCAAMLIVFLIIEAINPYAGFINHRYTRIIFWTLSLASLLCAILLIAAQRREFRRRERLRWKQREHRTAETDEK